MPISGTGNRLEKNIREFFFSILKSVRYKNNGTLCAQSRHVQIKKLCHHYGGGRTENHRLSVIFLCNCTFLIGAEGKSLISRSYYTSSESRRFVFTQFSRFRFLEFPTKALQVYFACDLTLVLQVVFRTRFIAMYIRLLFFIPFIISIYVNSYYQLYKRQTKIK